MERNVFTPEQETWLKALESGEWKQGRNFLHSGRDGHCCLGVADHVCDLGEVDPHYLHNTFGKLCLRSLLPSKL